ncbi:DUF998 domain-containing protein [Brevundimonas sp. FT23042]|uniref:DUF998 domain-containing protein n=1 Tax=Brevundimonas sp. FT23042 TaxID=3393749 RepID=UPI003B587505
MRALALACALLSLLILGAATFAGSAVYPDYDHLRQFISELGADGALTGPLVSLAFIVSGALLTVFWGLCAVLFPRTPLFVIGFGLSALNGLGLMFGGVFPCDFECAPGGLTLSGRLHEILGGVGYLAGVVGVFLTGLAARQQPALRGLFVLSLLCGLPALAVVWFVQPWFHWLGIAQRILETAFAVWAVAVAFSLRRLPETAR